MQHSIEAKAMPEKLFGGQSRLERSKYLSRDKHPLNNDLGLDQQESYNKLLHTKKRNTQAYFSQLGRNQHHNVITHLTYDPDRLSRENRDKEDRVNQYAQQI